MKLPLHQPYQNKVIGNAKKLRCNMTAEEMKLWYQYLRCYPIRFIRQKVIESYVIDFYCAKCRLNIELDGHQHYTEQGIGHDQARAELLNAYGVTVIRFPNERIRTDLSNVCHEIDSKAQELIQQSKA